MQAGSAAKILTSAVHSQSGQAESGKYNTRNTHAQSMPCAGEYPEICKSTFVATTWSLCVEVLYS